VPVIRIAASSTGSATGIAGGSPEDERGRRAVPKGQPFAMRRVRFISEG
jgi:hypothetical protein